MRHAQLLWVMGILAFGAAVVKGADDHEEAARELLKVSRAEQLVQNASAVMVNVMMQSNPRLAPFRDVIAEWSSEVITWDSMAPGLIEIYTSAFTTAEMGKITAFYRTPEGQKLLEKMPEMMQKQGELGMALAQAHQDALKTKIEARAKELQAQDKKQSE